MNEGDKMIPFYRPYFSRTELLSALSPNGGSEAFEAAVAKQLEAKFGVAFAYGRSALFATLQALNLNHAEIITTAYTCVVVIQPIVATGNIPVFVDIAPSSFNMSEAMCQQAISSRTRAVIVTHMYGYPADVDSIRKRIGDHKILIIEDCAQKLLSGPEENYHLRGDVGICSFGLNKELCTIQGGMAVTNSPEIYRKIREYRDRHLSYTAMNIWLRRWARLLANYLIFQEKSYGLLQRRGLVGQPNLLTELTEFDPARLPADYHTRFPDFLGRIGLAQLQKASEILLARRQLARIYHEELEGVTGLIRPPLMPEANFTYYTLRIPARDRLKFRQQMFDRGVAIDETYEYAVPYLKPYRQYCRSDYPKARQVARQVVNLPIYPHLSPEKARYIARCVREIVM